jgi:arylsulfatase
VGDDCTEDMYPDFLYEDNWVAQNALTLLRRKPSDQPWFLQVSFPGPHPPFLVTSNMSKSVRGRSFPPPHDDSPPTSNHHPNEEQRCRWNRQPKTSNSDRCYYGAEIENIDKLFGLILNELQLLGEYNNTIVCVSSDHGEMLGDHTGTLESVFPGRVQHRCHSCAWVPICLEL